MSAYLVGPEHISILLWAGHERFHRPGHKLTWEFDNPTRVHQLTEDNLTQVGQMLVDANNASVNYRYSESLQPYEYRYARPRFTSWSLVEILKTLECYEYHASERRDWPTSEAYAFCRALQTQLGQAIPGYDSAPWGITAASRPAAQPYAS
jgi:hypothetical protein